MKDAVLALLARYPHAYKRALALKPDTYWEPILFLRLLRPGDVVLDIGAHRGAYTSLFAGAVGSRGAVHAFEPVPGTFARLQKRIARLRRGDAVHLVPAAVGRAEGRGLMHVPAVYDGYASLRRQSDGPWAHAASVDTVPCPVITIDRYARDTSLAFVSFMKIDIEGAELEALAGAAATIAAHRPLIFLEVSHAWMKPFSAAPMDAVLFLAARGYDRFIIFSPRAQRLHNPAAELLEGRLPLSANLLCAVSHLHADRLAAAQLDTM